MTTTSTASSPATTSNLRYVATKSYVEDGQKFEITVKARLNDECKNGHCSFGVTCDIYRVARNGRRVDWGGGADHEAILKHFPKLAPIVALHLSDAHGVPMHAVANGCYWFNEGKRDVAIKKLRLTEMEADELQKVADDKLYFKFQLYSLGIVERWENEAREAIRLLEQLCHQSWINPYSIDVERTQIDSLTEEEFQLIAGRLSSGYYTPEAIEKRKAEERTKKIEDAKAEIIKYYDERIAKESAKKAIDLAILDSGILNRNYIYYDHNKTLVFNWKEYEKKITDEEIEHFKSVTDFSKLPDGIVIKNENKGR